ncbi:MAG: lysozyme family protein [Ethanoligenens sp.]
MLDKSKGYTPSDHRTSDVSYSARSRPARRTDGAQPSVPRPAAKPHSRSPARGPVSSAGQAHSPAPSAPASAETGGAFTRSRKWTDKPKNGEAVQRAAAYSHAKPGVQPVSRQRTERPIPSTAAPVRPPGRAGGYAPRRQQSKAVRSSAIPSAGASTAAVSRSASAVAETASTGAALSRGDSEKQEDVQDSGARAGNAGKNGASLAAAQATRRMKRQMRKRQAEHAAEKGAAGTVKTVRGFAEKAKALFQLIAKGGGKAALAVAMIALLVLFLIALVASCATLLNGALGGVSSVTFSASDSDIDKAEVYYSAKEANLQAQIDSAQTNHPGYDQYDYAVGAIGHNPVALIAYLTTAYGDFSFESIKPDLDALFSAQYQFTFTARTETRTRNVTTTDPNTGQTSTTQQSYPYKILTVKLNAQDFITLATARLNGTNGAVAAFNAYLQSKGNRQYFANPFSFGWSAYTTLYSDNRASIDVPEGTQALAALDGTVTTADGGTVVISGSNGLSVEYDGCGTMQVRAGQSIAKGAHVALTGSGFSIVFTHNGEHLNPFIFADTGDTADNAAVPIGGQPVGGSVEAYRATVTQLAPQYGMGAYVNLILAVMEQESGGRGGDPMQAAEGPFNTRFPKRPNGITDPTYSIACGIQELHQNLQLAGCTGPTDMAGIALALQGYNFGSGFISWARGHGGYTLANAQAFAQAEASALGWSSYGDPYYVPHVLRYYKST